MSDILLRSNRNYRLILSGSVATSLADGVAGVAMPWLAALLTRDPLMVSAVAAAESLPWFLFALPAGVWTDRADRRRLMIRADGVRLIATLCVVAMAISVPTGTAGAGPAATLAAIALLLGTAQVVRDNAAQTILPSVVAPGDLERANGQMGSAQQVVGRFIGPPLAGVLIAAGVALPFGFNAAAIALSVGALWLVTLPRRTPGGGGRFWPALRQGLGWLRRSPMILRLAAMVGVVNMVAVGGMAVFVLYAQDVLHVPASAYGLLLACAAAGGASGGLAAPAVARRLGMRASLLAALFGFVLLHLGLGLFSSVPVAGLAMFVEAFAGAVWNVVTVSYRQRLIPEGLLGRVNATYRFVAWGAMPFGALGAGAVVTVLEPGVGRTAALHTPYLAGAAICAALLAYGWAKLRFR